MKEEKPEDERMPQALEDLDDVTVGDSIDSDKIFEEVEEQQQQQQQEQEKEDEPDPELDALVARIRSRQAAYEKKQREGGAGGATAGGPSPLKEELQKLPKELRNILAGGFSGMIAKSVVAPVDRIKILYQVSSEQFHFRNLPHVARNIIRNEGVAALWKGNIATLIRIFPYSGIQFMVFDRLKTYFLAEHEKERIRYKQWQEEMHMQQQLQQEQLVRAQQQALQAHVTNANQNLDSSMNSMSSSNSSNHMQRKHRRWGLTPMESLGAGMLAGALSVVCTYPLDLTRAQLAVLKRHRHSDNIGFFGVLRNTYQQRGFRALWRGITPTLAGMLPYSGIAFGLNEQGKREIQHLTGHDVTMVQKMICGGFAGLVAQSVTYPIEVVRRRMQTIGMVGSSTALGSLSTAGATATSTAGRVVSEQLLDKPPPSLGNIIQSLYAEQGIRGFYKGVSMNWIKGPIAFSISFTCFDIAQGLMESDSEKALRLPRQLTRRFTLRPKEREGHAE